MWVVDAEKRIISGSYTFEDKSAVWDIIDMAIKKIVFPSVFHVLFADRNFIGELQQRLQTIVAEKGKHVFAGRLSSRIE
jgi:hypothetical protein